MARFIVWVRRHWVCTELTETTWRIWDSASSVIVRKDLEKWAKQLNWPRPQFEPSPQQVRGSNECGLYAAFFLLARCWGRQIPVPGTTSRTTVRHCAAHARDPGRFVEEMEKALTAAEGTTTTATIGSGRYQHNPYSHTVLAGGREDANILSRTMETARKLGSVTARQNNCYMLVAQCLMDVLADKATECTAKTLAETASTSNGSLCSCRRH